MNIILTSSLKEKPIDGEHRYVCVGLNCWGMSTTTAKEAHANAKKEAPYKYRGLFITRVVHKSFTVDPVDGSVTWNEDHNAKDCPLCTVGKGIRITKEGA
ncbi:MAG: hypothetical protein JWR19_2184 [Pedosphaera sp.]|nr:hypothetical protein [Pedosphaera sp.]